MYCKSEIVTYISIKTSNCTCDTRKNYDEKNEFNITYVHIMYMGEIIGNIKLHIQFIIDNILYYYICTLTLNVEYNACIMKI